MVIKHHKKASKIKIEREREKKKKSNRDFFMILNGSLMDQYVGKCDCDGIYSVNVTVTHSNWYL